MTNGTYFWHATLYDELNLSAPFIWDVTTRHWIFVSFFQDSVLPLISKGQNVQKNFILK